MTQFELTLNIDFHDVLNTAGKGASPGVGENDHYPVELLERIIRLAAESGFQEINFRTDYIGWVGINGSPERDLPVHHQLFMNTLAAYDPLERAIELSHQYGLKCNAWLTPLDDTGPNPAWEGERDIHQSSFSRAHPEFHLCKRDGKDRFGIYCFGYPKVREYMLTHLRRILVYKPDGVLFSNRTHANFGPEGSKLEYGFNEPTLAEYQRRYGCDPRNEDDYDLEKFSEVLGSFYTEFLREAAAECRKVNVPVAAMVSWQQNGRIAPRLGALDKAFFQWQTWIHEGLIDTLVMGGDAATSFDGSVHVLGFMDVETDSGNPEFFRKQVDAEANVRIVRWLTLHGWGWGRTEDLDEGGHGPSGSFKPELVLQMLEKVRASGADGAFLHEADNININDQWAHYRKRWGRTLDR